MNVAEYQQLVREQQSEHDLQLEVTRWLIADLGPNVAWSAVDHATKLTERQGRERKRRGVVAGQADYRFVIPPDGRSAEIELKRPVKASKQSDPQIAWEARVTAAGGLYAVCRSIPEVEGTLRAWGLLPIPARVAA